MAKNPLTFTIPLPSGFLFLCDPKNLDDTEKWHSVSTAKRGHKIDFDGAEQELLTSGERASGMQHETLPDGVLRIFGKTHQETGHLLETKRRLIANNGYHVRIEAGPIDQSVALIEDAARADRAGFVPSLDGVVIKLGTVPGRHLPAKPLPATIVFDEDGNPETLTVDLRQPG